MKYHQANLQRKVFAIQVTDKGLTSVTCKEFLQSNRERSNAYRKNKQEKHIGKITVKVIAVIHKYIKIYSTLTKL